MSIPCCTTISKPTPFATGTIRSLWQDNSYAETNPPSLLESLPFPTLRRGLSYKLNAARCAIQWSRSLLHLHLQATESIWCGAPPDTTGVNTRRWPLFPVDLPVHVVVRNGIDSLKTTGRGGPRRHGPLRRSYSGTR